MDYSIKANSDDYTSLGSGAAAGNSFGPFEVVDSAANLIVLMVILLAVFLFMRKG